jgi:hypothetical protein
MKTGCSAGLDGIHPCILKETSIQIAQPLHILFEISMKSSCLPSSWKDATVVPIFKKGVCSNPGNYHPVSLTSVCGKLIDRLVRRKVLEHINENNRFSAN